MYINWKVISIQCIKAIVYSIACHLKDHSMLAESFICPYWSHMKELFWACWVRWRSAQPMCFDAGERYSQVYEWAGRLASGPGRKEIKRKHVWSCPSLLICCSWSPVTPLACKNLQKRCWCWCLQGWVIYVSAMFHIRYVSIITFNHQSSYRPQKQQAPSPPQKIILLDDHSEPFDRKTYIITT